MNEPMPAAATDISSVKLDLKDACRSAKTELEVLMDQMYERFYAQPQRDGISKEERRKRTKAKKQAKKQRNK